MKKALFILSMLFILVGLSAQNEPTKDTTKIKLGNRTIIIVEDKNEDQKDKELQIEEEIIIEDSDDIEISDIPESPMPPDAAEPPDFEDSDDEFIDQEVEIGDKGHNRKHDKDIRIKKKKKHEYDVDDYSRWSGFNLGFNQLRDINDYSSLAGANEIFDNKIWSSRTWNLNLFDYSLSLVKRHILLTTGIGFEFRNLSFKKDFDLLPSGDNIEPVLTNIDYTKNKLRANYVQVPLLLEINTSSKPKKGLYLGAGVIGGYKMYSVMMQEYELNGREEEKVIHDQNGFNLNDIQLQATLRMGIGRLTFFGNFDLLPMFENSNVGEDLANVNFGVQLIGFN
jgi:hypothetical protein